MGYLTRYRRGFDTVSGDCEAPLREASLQIVAARAHAVVTDSETVSPKAIKAAFQTDLNLTVALGTNLTCSSAQA